MARGEAKKIQKLFQNLLTNPDEPGIMNTETEG